MANPYGAPAVTVPDQDPATEGHAPDNNEPDNPGQAESTDEQFVVFKRWWQEARDKSHKWRTEATEDYDFVAGHHWSPEDESLLKEQLRPIVTFNRIDLFMAAISGMEVTNRQEVRYIPRQLGDAGVNELLTAAAKWFRDQSNSEESESDAFLDTGICGMGWIDSRLDYEDDPNGTAVSERIDPLEMYWDPVAKKRNLKDRRYHVRAKRMPLTEAKGMFPDHADADLDAAWAIDQYGREDAEPHNATEAKFYKNDQSGREGAGSRRLVTILEFEWWDRENYLRIAEPTTGELKQYPLATGQRLIKFARTKGINLKGVVSKRKAFKRAFVGARILESGPSPYPEGFKCNPITGKRDRNHNSWYGVVRVLKDPQRWANKYLSTLQHYISTVGKGILAETGVFENPRKAEEDWSKADSITLVKEGAIAKGKIAGKPGGQIPQEVMGLLEFSISSMRDVTGIPLEMLGQAEHDQPGILEYQRKQTGLTVLAVLFDALRQFRKMQGEVLLYYIQNYFSDGRLIRIDGEQGAKFIRLIRDHTVGEYEVIVDEATSSPNQKEQTWVALQPLLPVIGKLLPPSIWQEIVPYLPLPESLTSKLKTAIAQQAQNPQQDPKVQAHLIDAQSGLMEAKTNQFQAQLEAQRMQMEAQEGPMKMQLEAEKTKAQTENLRASALAALIKAGIQMSEPQLEVYQQALDGLLGIHEKAIDHKSKLIQQSQAHGHAMQQAYTQHDQAMQQARQSHGFALEQNAQQAALQPEPSPA